MGIETMKTVILCGGKGTRIRDVTNEIPKPLLPIGGRPILWHIMKTYAHHGFADFVLCLGYRGWQVKEFFLNYEAMTTDLTITLGRPSTVEYLDQHPEQGWRVTLAETGLESQTGDRVRLARKYLEEQPFLFTYGDGVADVNLTELVRFHRSHGKIGTMTGVRPPGRFGEIQADGDRVTSFAEKPQAAGGLINGGFCVFEPEIFDYIPERLGIALEIEPLQRLAAEGELQVYRHDGFWQPMDTLREHDLLNNLWQQGAAPWRVWS
jgi:glucose-1-phosphate cytidylyltransferase